MRRRDTEAATGALSRETRKRDRARRQSLVEPPTSGREVEKSAALERRPPEIEQAPRSDLATYVPPDPDQIGVTRRQFLNRSIVACFGISLAAASAPRCWPSCGRSPQGGFGSKVIQVGKITDIAAGDHRRQRLLLLRPRAALWMTRYPLAASTRPRRSTRRPVLASMEAGVTVVYQKCPHLGCRVPSCLTSQWFECPCHGSQYNQAGEKKGGPAPRGMDRFATTVDRRRAHRRHRHHHPGPADRHRHHRPGGRRTALRRGGALMPEP